MSVSVYASVYVSLSVSVSVFVFESVYVSWFLYVYVYVSVSLSMCVYNGTSYRECEDCQTNGSTEQRRKCIAVPVHTVHSASTQCQYTLYTTDAGSTGCRGQAV